MALRVAIQMDPIDSIDINGDSTFVLALEAQRRGHALFHYQPHHMSFRDGRVSARVAPLTVQRVAGDHAHLGAREAVGAINRVPAAGEARSNMHVGGRAVKCDLTARDREICEIIGPTLRAQGQIFVGIDVIGDYLTEINVTSPTGIQELNRFDDVAIEATIWDAIEARLAS